MDVLTMWNLKIFYVFVFIYYICIHILYSVFINIAHYILLLYETISSYWEIIIKYRIDINYCEYKIYNSRLFYNVIWHRVALYNMNYIMLLYYNVIIITCNLQIQYLIAQLYNIFS